MIQACPPPTPTPNGYGSGPAQRDKFSKLPSMSCGSVSGPTTDL